MAIDVGSVFVRLGFREDDRGFRDWERNVVRAQQVKDIKADLGAVFDDREFHRYDRALTGARAKAKERDAFKARLGADFDSRAFNSYYREVDKARRKTDEMKAPVGLLARLFGQTGDAAASAGGAIGGGGGLAGRVGFLSGALGPLLGALVALLPVIVAVGGAAVALGGSLAAAAAGAAAIGVGIAAAAGPLAALAAAVAQRVGLITEAFSALDAQQTKSGASAKSQADTQAAAAQQIKNAEEGLADAQRGVVSAQEALTVARFRARREIDDLRIALDRTNLSEQRTNLNLEQATQRLAEVQADPTATRFDLRDATLAVKEAQEALREARVERNRAITDAKRGTDTVRVAEEQVADARRGAARASAQVAQAQTAAAKATEKQGAAADTAQQALAKLTRTERNLLTTVRRTMDVVQRTLQPATDAIFGSVDRGLQAVTPVIARFRGRFKGIGEAVGDAVESASRSLTGPRWTRALESFAVTAQHVVKPVSDAMGSVAVILRNVAVAAQPYVRALADETARFFGGIAGQTDDADRMRRIVRELVGHLVSWARLGASITRLMFTIFNSGARDGKSLVETLTSMVDRWNRFLSTREGQERLRQFFRDSIEAVKAIGKAILVLTPIVAGLVGELIKVVAWFGKNKAAAVALGVAVTGLAVAFGGPITAITAVTAALITAYRTSRTFREVVSYSFQSIRSIIGGNIDTILGILTTFLGGLSSFAQGFSFIPGVGRVFRGAATGIDRARDAIDSLRKTVREATNPMEQFSKGAEDMGHRTYRSFSQMRKDVAQQVDRIKRATLDGSQESKDALAQNFRVAAAAVERSTSRMGGSTQAAMKRIHTLMVDALHAYGLKAEDAHKLFPDYEQRVAAGLAAGPPSPKAQGGWVGSPGASGPDTVAMNAPLGAAVLNRHQLPYAAAALAGIGVSLDDVALGRSGGGMTAPILVGHGEFLVDPMGVGLLDGALGMSGLGGLDDLFSSVTRPHYLAGGGRVTGDTDYGREMTTAMNALATAYGSSIFVQSGRRTMAEQAALARSKGTYSASNPTGAAAPSPNAPHVRGVAADITPGRAALAGLAGRFGLGFPLPAEPWHIQLLSSIGARAATDISARQVLPRVNVNSHGGLFTLIGQGATNIARRAAQGLLDFASERTVMGGEVAPGGGGKAGSTSQVRAWVAAGLRLAGIPATPRNIATVAGRAMQESGGNPRAQNNWDVNAQRGDPSRGLLQTIGSTFRRYAVKGHTNILNPVDNTAAAVRYMLATYGHLVGAGPGGYAKGGRVRKTAGHGSAHGSATNLKLLSTSSLPKDRIAAYDDLLGTIEDDRKLYVQADRRYGLTDEVLIDPDTGALDTVAIQQRADELTGLLAIRQRILDKLRRAERMARQIIRSYRSIVTRLTASLRRAKGKQRSGIRGQLSQAQEALGEWRKTAHELGFDITDAGLDVQEIIGERAGVLGTQATPQAAADITATDTTTGEPAVAPPSPADIAASAIADVTAYLAAQQQSLGAYSRNFVTPLQAARPGGVFSGTPNQLAALGGAKYLGAGGEGPLGGAVGRSVTITNNYLQIPDNTQTWSSQMRYQIEAAVG